jgi:hypothetical protein
MAALVYASPLSSDVGWDVQAPEIHVGPDQIEAANAQQEWDMTAAYGAVRPLPAQSLI